MLVGLIDNKNGAVKAPFLFRIAKYSAMRIKNGDRDNKHKFC